MEKGLRILQSMLFIVLGIAIAVFAFSLWKLLSPDGQKTPYANARFVNLPVQEVRI